MNNAVLADVRVLVLCSEKLAGEFQRVLSGLCGELVVASLFALRPVPQEKVSVFFAKLEEYDYVTLTSRYAVELLLQRVKDFGLSLCAVPDLLVVGRKTFEDCVDGGLTPCLLPRESSVKGLMRALVKVPLEKKRVLCCSGNLSPDTLEEYLRARGAFVGSCVLYENRGVAPQKQELETLRAFCPDYVLCCSPSSVVCYVRFCGPLPRAEYLAMGQSTAGTLRNYGVGYPLTPAISSVGGMVDCLLRRHSIILRGFK